MHLHRFAPGWLAVAVLAGEVELGWGDQRTAIAMALADLGPAAQDRFLATTDRLLADPDGAS